MGHTPIPAIFGGAGFKDFDKFFVGFDDQFNRLAKIHDDVTKNIPNYPPYNIRKTGDNTYVIEIAVAGVGDQPDIYWIQPTRIHITFSHSDPIKKLE